LLVEPEGLAAKVIMRAGLSAERVYAAVGAGPATAGGDATAADLSELNFTSAGGAVLKASLKLALRFGHNYIGTEHMLLGILYSEGNAGRALASAGLDAETAERLLADEFAALKARRAAS
jgi:ATP-dependent Clp protease ATP-binding subunit ClpA